MTLGIFGDSYVCHKALMQDDGSSDEKTKKFMHSLLTWVEYLEINHGITSDNHGCMGSSIFYSYSKFLEHHEQYDTIVFVVSQNDRINIPLEYLRDRPEFLKSTCFNLQTAGFGLNSEYKDIRTISKVAIDYFTYLHNEIAYMHFANLMVSDIKRKCEKKNIKLLIIPAFSLSQTGTDELVTENSDGEGILGQVSILEEQAWGLGIDDISESEVAASFFDVRTCHMTDDNNRILAQKIADWVRHGHAFNLNVGTDFIAPTMDDKFKYFVPK